MFIVAYYCCCSGSPASFRFPTSSLKPKSLEMTKKRNQKNEYIYNNIFLIIQWFIQSRMWPLQSFCTCKLSLKYGKHKTFNIFSGTFWPLLALLFWFYVLDTLLFWLPLKALIPAVISMQMFEVEWKTLENESKLPAPNKMWTMKAKVKLKQAETPLTYCFYY